MFKTSMRRAFYLLMVLAILLSVFPVAAAPGVTSGGTASTESSGTSTATPTTNSAIFFAADGMRPDLMEKYIAEGALPTYADLLAKGVKGDNGLVQAFPPNTGVGWYTLATGTYPGEHGSTNNTFHRTGE